MKKIISMFLKILFGKITQYIIIVISSLSIHFIIWHCAHNNWLKLSYYEEKMFLWRDDNKTLIGITNKNFVEK